MSANATPPVGAFLREQRREAGLSQQALAAQAGCSIAMVRLLESGYLPSSGSVIERITAALVANREAA